jgi:hypothetical protein
VNGRFRLPAITLADVVAEATGWPLDADAAEEAARVTIEAVADATETIATPELATHVRARAHQLLDD